MNNNKWELMNTFINKYNNLIYGLYLMPFVIKPYCPFLASLIYPKSWTTAEKQLKPA